MQDISIGEIVITVISAASGLIAWFGADIRSKVRLGYVEEKIAAVKKLTDLSAKENDARIRAIEIDITRGQQDRSEFHRGLERLDSSKASKEVVDGFRTEISTLRVDMDKRFDRLERLLESYSRAKENHGSSND